MRRYGRTFDKMAGIFFKYMKYQLRPYQVESIDLLRKGFSKNKRQILCLPTGSGKTVVFSSIIEQAAAKGSQTLVLTHRIELFNQTWRAIDRLGINPAIITAETKKIDPGAVVSIAMVETIKRRIKKFGNEFPLNPYLVIIDEAHFANFNDIIDYFDSAYVIGATATPVGKHFFKYYTGIVSNVDIPDLIEQNYLCGYRAFQMQDDFSEVKISKGEFEESSLFAHFDKVELYDGVVDKYIEKCNGKKTVVFNCNIQHSNNTSDAFNKAGIKSYSITSYTTKDDRENILRMYENGEFRILNNCGILTTGWDCPSVECVIVNRATMSLPLWLQMCGRGSRTYPGKEKFTVLDFGKNHDRHGMWNEPRQWKIEAPKKKTERAAPTKECPSCFAMLFASVRVCSECGYEFIAADKETEIKEGVLVEIQPRGWQGKWMSDLSIEELADITKLKIENTQFIWRVVRSHGKEGIRYYSKLMGYKSGWEWHQLQSVFDSQYTNKIVKKK